MVFLLLPSLLPWMLSPRATLCTYVPLLKLACFLFFDPLLVVGLRTGHPPCICPASSVESHRLELAGPAGLPLQRCWPAALPGARIVSLRVALLAALHLDRAHGVGVT
jgi:hypothetical protein